jgi:hypothetical protein
MVWSRNFTTKDTKKNNSTPSSFLPRVAGEDEGGGVIFALFAVN